jgi:hypothetical protein
MADARSTIPTTTAGLQDCLQQFFDLALQMQQKHSLCVVAQALRTHLDSVLRLMSDVGACDARLPGALWQLYEFYQLPSSDSTDSSKTQIVRH